MSRVLRVPLKRSTGQQIETPALPKSNRAINSCELKYLENKLIDTKNNYTIKLVLSIRIFWYATRLYSKRFEKWHFYDLWPWFLTSCQFFKGITLFFTQGNISSEKHLKINLNDNTLMAATHFPKQPFFYKIQRIKKEEKRYIGH